MSLSIAVDATLGLVSMQNAIPVVRQIQFTNVSSEVLTNV